MPEQINLQIASPDTVVVAFVTYESPEDNSAPFVMWGLDEKSLQKTTGVTHHYELPRPGEAEMAEKVRLGAMSSDLRAKERRTEQFVLAHANGTAFEGMAAGPSQRALQELGETGLLTVTNTSFCATG
eukprot:SAG31_NODE_8552_length_1431_cov_1.666667_1_plen_127_part_01